MGYYMETKRSCFFNELSKDNQKEYFGITRDKFLPTIDNIYYSVFIKGDYNGNPLTERFIRRLAEAKSIATRIYQPFDYGFGLQAEVKGTKGYKYCLSEPDLYDIFIAGSLPNEKTPRIVVQIRALGLWTHGAEKMLIDSFKHVTEVLGEFKLDIEKCRENRIDFCYHTNIISNPDKTFSDENLSLQVDTALVKWNGFGRVDKADKDSRYRAVHRKDYLAYGSRRSNYAFVRIYNKTKEVIEQGYKNFFFEIWYKQGLISFYDKFCLEYALPHKNLEYVHKGKLAFYVKYGTDERVRLECELTLNDPKSTLKDFKALAHAYMPEVTTIMNIEFETKRKFYYYSENFIKHFKYIERHGLPEPLTWLFKIIDNRSLFLNFLTSDLFSLRKPKPSDDYVFWWERLRNTKLDGYKTDDKLLRKYSQNLDERLTRIRAINTVVTNAVYNDNVDTDFIEDISDLLSNLNDNHKQVLKVKIYGNNRRIIKDFSGNSELLADYRLKKTRKNMQLKNRKKARQTKPKAETKSVN